MEEQEKNHQVEIHCPTEAELQAEPQVNVPCTVDGCIKTFSTSAARNIHMIQTHKIYKNEDERKRFNRSQQKHLSKVTKHFYCPVQMCNRSIDWAKPFSRLSLLKQHYYILHAEKKYQCGKCEKRFSTQRQCSNHDRDCGKEFFCTCGEKHNSVTALYMHAKRKQHALPEEFSSKRRKREPVKEGYVLVVPVPFNNSEDIQKMIKEPFPLLPRPSTYIPIARAIPGGSHIQINRGGPVPATMATAAHVGFSHGGACIGQMNVGHYSATTSTQTDESGLTRLPPKQTTSTAYAQTAHSCFPSFIPMMNGPRTFKRHKKTLAIQTHTNWPQDPDPSKMATSETQTLGGQGNTAQTQTVLDLSSAMPGCPAVDQAAGNPLFPQYGAPSVPFNSQQVIPSSILDDSALSSNQYNYCVNTTQIQNNSNHSNPHLDTNNSRIPHATDTAHTNQTSMVTMPSVAASNIALPPNEVLTQTDLTFQNFLEYNTSETQTFANVSDAMTDTSETPAASSSSSGQSAGPVVATECLGTTIQGNNELVSSTSDIEMTGLDLLFLASTEHRALSSLDMPRMDDSSCCQQTQTGLEAITGHQETQTAWDWSLDEFSFLDQYTQTALSASSSSGSNGNTPASMQESDQFCQTGMDLYSQFNFSNTETQTVSVFDLEMFGNSISVQTETGSGSSSRIPGEEGLSNVSTQVQVSSSPPPQEMVCADAQTEAIDFNRLRGRQLGSSQLASSQTQTSFWEDIESIMRSDNFTQTQFP